MNETITQLNERLGALNHKLSSLNNERASVRTSLSALNDKDQLTDEDRTKLTNLNTQIDAINDKKTRFENEKKIVKDELAEAQKDAKNGVNNDIPAHFNGNYNAGGNTAPSNEEKEIGKYSLVKAIREAGQNSLTGFEKEMAEEAAKNARDNGLSLEGNLAIPKAVLDHNFNNALSVDGGSGGDKGGDLVQTNKGSLIDALRAKLPFVELGATMLTGLQGNLSIPRVSSQGSDPAVKSEVAAADEVDPSFDSIELTPNRLPAFTEYSRKLLLQSSTSVEQFVRNNLAFKLGKAMHSSIMTSLLANGGVNSVAMGTDGAALSWAKVVEGETAVKAADAGEEENAMAYLTNSKVTGSAKTIEKASNTARFLLENGQLNGYNVAESSLVPSNLTKGGGTNLSAMIFANWPYLYIAMWGGIDLLVNPYSLDKEGKIRINIWTHFDHGIRHDEAFSVYKDIIA